MTESMIELRANLEIDTFWKRDGSMRVGLFNNELADDKKDIFGFVLDADEARAFAALLLAAADAESEITLSLHSVAYQKP